MTDKPRREPLADVEELEHINKEGESKVFFHVVVKTRDMDCHIRKTKKKETANWVKNKINEAHFFHLEEIEKKGPLANNGKLAGKFSNAWWTFVNGTKKGERCIFHAPSYVAMDRKSFDEIEKRAAEERDKAVVEALERANKWANKVREAIHLAAIASEILPRGDALQVGFETIFLMPPEGKGGRRKGEWIGGRASGERRFLPPKIPPKKV
jgi:hypothetical protein